MRAAHGWWMPLLLGLAIALAYANGLAVGFHFDDWHVIQKNPHIRSLASIPSFFVDPDSSSVSRENRLVRPLLLVSFALNYAVSGERPWSYHLLNLLLHWCVVVLVFRIVRDHFWLGDAALPVAAGAALVVAVHPLNTSAVDYITARSAVMAAACYLAAFDAAVRDRRAAAVAFFVLALLTKEIVFTLPLALLGYRLLAPGAGGPRPALRLIGWLAGLGVAGLAYRAILLPPSVVAATHASDVGSWRYFMTGWSAYLYYLRLFLWPNALVVDRLDYPVVRTFAEPQAWASLAGLVGLGTLAWKVRRRLPALSFAFVWFVVALAAESTVFPLAEAVNEHRPYLAMLGLGTAASLGLWHAVTLVAPARRMPAFAAVVGVVACGLGWAAHARTEVWRDDYTLWLDATRKAPANARAWTNAGHAALARGHYDEARPLLVEGQRLAPCYSYALLNLSAVERLTGRLADALRWGDEGVRCNPGLALPHLYRAAALEALGRRDEAIDEARRTTDIDPQAVDAWMQQGRLLEQGERWADAAAAYDGALAADPTLTDAAMDAGVLYHYRLGDSARAAARYRAALAAVPTHYGAHYQLAIALFATGAETDAVAAWRAFVPLAEAIGDQASLARAPARLRELAAPRSS